MVERPVRAAAAAAEMPAGPPPSTTTSYSPRIGVLRLGSLISAGPCFMRSSLFVQALLPEKVSQVVAVAQDELLHFNMPCSLKKVSRVRPGRGPQISPTRLWV